MIEDAKIAELKRKTDEMRQTMAYLATGRVSEEMLHLQIRCVHPAINKNTSIDMGVRHRREGG